MLNTVEMKCRTDARFSDLKKVLYKQGYDVVVTGLQLTATLNTPQLNICDVYNSTITATYEEVFDNRGNLLYRHVLCTETIQCSYNTCGPANHLAKIVDEAEHETCGIVFGEGVR